MEFHTQKTQFGNAVWIKNLNIEMLDILMAKYGYEILPSLPKDSHLRIDRYYYHKQFGMALLRDNVLEATGIEAQRYLQQLVDNQDIEWIWHV